MIDSGRKGADGNGSASAAARSRSVMNPAKRIRRRAVARRVRARGGLRNGDWSSGRWTIPASSAASARETSFTLLPK